MVTKEDVELVALNPDGKKGSSKTKATNRGGNGSSSKTSAFISLCKIYAELYPKVFYGVSGFLLVSLVLCVTVFKPKFYQRNFMQYDYSGLRLDYNFKTAQIDHWCVFGNDDMCSCEDPTEFVPNVDTEGWMKAHERNKQFINDFSDQYYKNDLDVIFVGGDIVEEMAGYNTMKSSTGRVVNYKMNQMWNATFGSQGGGGGSEITSLRGTGEFGSMPSSNFKGLALGISGDRTPNLLWRLQNGELPTKGFNPKVIWIMTGANDLSIKGCSEEVVTLGILRTAEEIAFYFPKSTIVIQALLPRSNDSYGKVGYDARIRNHNGDGRMSSKYKKMSPMGIHLSKKAKYFDMENPPKEPLPSQLTKEELIAKYKKQKLESYQKRQSALDDIHQQMHKKYGDKYGGDKSKYEAYLKEKLGKAGDAMTTPAKTTEAMNQWSRPSQTYAGTSSETPQSDTTTTAEQSGSTTTANLMGGLNSPPDASSAATTTTIDETETTTEAGTVSTETAPDAAGDESTASETTATFSGQETGVEEGGESAAITETSAGDVESTGIATESATEDTESTGFATAITEAGSAASTVSAAAAAPESTTTTEEAGETSDSDDGWRRQLEEAEKEDNTSDTKRKKSSDSGNGFSRSYSVQRPSHHHSSYYRKHDLWPSIQAINKELELFCQKHDHIVYFDSTELFLGSIGNKHYRQKGQQIISDLMPDFIHLSTEGYRVLYLGIIKELKRIILDHNEANDIEHAD